MRTGAKVGVVALLALAVAGTVALRGGSQRGEQAAPAPPPAAAPQSEAAPAAPDQAPASQATAVTPDAPRAEAAAARPRLLEIGSTRCQACQEMGKVLDALRASQGERLRIDFIDVFERPEDADPYDIKLIPTQILFDAAGREIFRHQGYFSHDDILAKFQELGVAL